MLPPTPHTPTTPISPTTGSTETGRDRVRRFARRFPMEAALCLSAGVLAAAALVQASSFFAGAPNLSGLPLTSVANAQTAQMVAAGNGYSILSTNTSGEANVLVQDARAEELTVYRTDSQGLLTPVQRIRLQSVFVEGRARFGGQ